MSSQAGICARSRCEFAVGGDDARFLLAGEGLFAQFVPALVEFSFVLVRPVQRDVVRRVGSAGREVDEEGLIGNEGFLLPDPVDGLVVISSIR